MADIIKASANAIKTFVGPIAFPIDFFLSLYGDKQAKDFEGKIVREIHQGHELTREVLEAIIEVKKNIRKVREQFICGLAQCNEPLKMNMKAVASPGLLESKLLDWLRVRGKRFRETGLLTEKDIVDELVRVYRLHYDHFVAVVDPVGFPTEQLSSDDLRMRFVEFVNICASRLQAFTVSRVFDAICEDCEAASDVLNVCASIWKEVAENQDIAT